MTGRPLGAAPSCAEDWTTYAACADAPHLPWLRDSAEVSAWDALTMSVVCDSCPVKELCETAAQDWGVTGGWWAGRDRDPRAARTVLAPDWVLLIDRDDQDDPDGNCLDGAA